MALTTRSSKGVPLTHAEMDANFEGLADGSLITELDSSKVPFIPSGSGASARDMQSKAREIVSADDFLQDADSDDSDAFQRAFAAVGNGAVFASARFYDVSEQCDVTGRLYGARRGSVVRVNADVTPFVINADRASVENINIFPTVSTTKPAIDVQDYVGFWKIEDVFINTAGGFTFHTGIKVTEGLSGDIINPRIDGAGTYGIHITGPLGGNVPNAIHIQHPKVRNSGTSDIFCENASHGPSIFHPVLEGTCLLKLHIKSCNEASVYDPYFESTGAAAGASTHLKLEDSSGATVFNGAWGNTALLDIDLNNADRTTIIGYNGDATTQIDIDSNTTKTTIIGGQINSAKFTNNGTLTKIYNGDGMASGIAAAPGMAFALDNDTGFAALVANTIALICGGAQVGSIGAGTLSLSRAGSSIITAHDTDSGTRIARYRSTTVNGQWEWGAKEGTGTNWQMDGPSNNTVSVVEFFSNPADGNTALLLMRNVGGTITCQQVSLGAADSGGAGFKVLRMPN